MSHIDIQLNYFSQISSISYSSDMSSAASTTSSAGAGGSAAPRFEVSSQKMAQKIEFFMLLSNSSHRDVNWPQLAAFHLLSLSHTHFFYLTCF